eukprot:6189163-Pyramimonas_sp.AAC.3
MRITQSEGLHRLVCDDNVLDLKAPTLPHTPLLSCTSVNAPPLISDRTVSTHPSAAARCNGAKPATAGQAR